jgi:hypothetical protein
VAGGGQIENRCAAGCDDAQGSAGRGGDGVGLCGQNQQRRQQHAGREKKENDGDRLLGQSQPDETVAHDGTRVTNMEHSARHKGADEEQVGKAG